VRSARAMHRWGRPVDLSGLTSGRGEFENGAEGGCRSMAWISPASSRKPPAASRVAIRSWPERRGGGSPPRPARMFWAWAWSIPDSAPGAGRRIAEQQRSGCDWPRRGRCRETRIFHHGLAALTVGPYGQELQATMFHRVASRAVGDLKGAKPKRTCCVEGAGVTSPLPWATARSSDGRLPWTVAELHRRWLRADAARKTLNRPLHPWPPRPAAGRAVEFSSRPCASRRLGLVTWVSGHVTGRPCGRHHARQPASWRLSCNGRDPA